LGKGSTLYNDIASPLQTTDDVMVLTPQHHQFFAREMDGSHINLQWLQTQLCLHYDN
jgi:hypothetical protein